MIGLIIITHHIIGDAYRGLATHFFPNETWENVKIVGVDNDDSHEMIIEKIEQVLPILQQSAGILMLVDIFGATPCNAVLKLVDSQKMAMLTGLNAPMLIKAVQYAKSSQNLTDFVHIVQNAAIQGIIRLPESDETNI